MCQNAFGLDACPPPIAKATSSSESSPASLVTADQAVATPSRTSERPQIIGDPLSRNATNRAMSSEEVARSPGQGILPLIRAPAGPPSIQSQLAQAMRVIGVQLGVNAPQDDGQLLELGFDPLFNLHRSRMLSNGIGPSTKQSLLAARDYCAGRFIRKPSSKIFVFWLARLYKWPVPTNALPSNVHDPQHWAAVEGFGNLSQLATFLWSVPIEVLPENCRVSARPLSRNRYIKHLFETIGLACFELATLDVVGTNRVWDVLHALGMDPMTTTLQEVLSSRDRYGCLECWEACFQGEVFDWFALVDHVCGPYHSRGNSFTIARLQTDINKKYDTQYGLANRYISFRCGHCYIAGRPSFCIPASNATEKDEMRLHTIREHPGSPPVVFNEFKPVDWSGSTFVHGEYFGRPRESVFKL
ncbi:hypothetical protein BKA62DRAFT_78292 [Auriculariales sp. MPI-PUGE-AT-0066]|nr:hypothetical protein BKA62DRAFT_78292 [Auriculariales sp. MPI-PUGE-AT-0066]